MIRVAAPQTENLLRIHIILALRRVFTLLCCTMFAASSLASVEDLNIAYEKKDYAAAYAIAAPLAESGNARAQYLLGLMLWKGRGVTRDDAAAVTWLNKSTDQGYGDAMADLANMYSKGEGVAQDMARALALFRRGAEAGNAAAQFNLGRLYEHGNGVKKDHVLARYWYERADARELSQLPKPPRDGVRPAISSLPNGCRPALPPIRAMKENGVTEVAGRIVFYVDAEGRVRGVTERAVSVDALKFDVVAYFSTSLRSPECVLPETARAVHIEIPFRFILN